MRNPVDGPRCRRAQDSSRYIRTPSTHRHPDAEHGHETRAATGGIRGRPAAIETPLTVSNDAQDPTWIIAWLPPEHERDPAAACTHKCQRRASRHVAVNDRGRTSRSRP